MNHQVILVPTDFTKVAECAIEHSIILAKHFSVKIVLLHIVAKQSDVDENRKKIEALAAELSKKNAVVIEGHVRIGNIFEDISDAAVEHGAKFIVMGTHGVKGMQFITGSHALKVITSSEIPFIVVQEKMPKNEYKNIIVPLDLTKETKQKLQYSAEIAQKFGATIHVVYSDESDEYLSNQVKRNIVFSKKYLQDHHVSFTTKKIEKGNFIKEIIKYSESIQADLIAIMNVNDSLLPIFSGDARQQVLTNEALIPVLCVNPKETSVSHWK